MSADVSSWLCAVCPGCFLDYCFWYFLIVPLYLKQCLHSLPHQFIMFPLAISSWEFSCSQFTLFALSPSAAYKEPQCPPFSAFCCGLPQQKRHSHHHHQSFSTVHLSLQRSGANSSVTTRSAHSPLPFKNHYWSTQSASASRVWISVYCFKPCHEMHKI